MMYLRRSNERGPSDLGWLHSRHSFSFGSYYDPDHMGVSVLRVINDDQVKAGAGFPTHSHQDMEIISYVKHGRIEHKDSMGNIEAIPAGEFQLMSAGTGVTHSEYNPSSSKALSFLQIWIEPNILDATPSYQQKSFGSQKGLTHIISPDGQNGTLRINQDAHLHRLLFDDDQTTDLNLTTGRNLYIHVISGLLDVNEHTLESGDGIGLSDVDAVHLHTQVPTEALVFDLPPSPKREQ